MLRLNVEDQLNTLNTPTLIIVGAADSLCEANIEVWQRLLNATLHVFSRVGHGIPREVPDKLPEVLKDFFEHRVVRGQTLKKLKANGN